MKKHTISIAILALLVLIISGCSTTSDTAIEELNSKVESLEQNISDSNLSIRDFEAKQDDLVSELEIATSEVETLTIENDELANSLEESQAEVSALAAAAIEVEEDPAPMAISPYPGMTVLAASLEVLDAMRTGDFATLSTYVDPANPVKFSPHQNIDFGSIFFLDPAQVAIIPTLPAAYPWGIHPASGDIITMTPIDYFNQYVYDEDYYLAPIVGMNNVVSSGNLINNIETSFPTADYVEFLFPGFDPTYAGQDWSSITLVFSTDLGMPMLIAVIHGEWTP